MKILQFKDEHGNNVYCATDTIMRFTEAKKSKTLVTFHNDEEQLINMKAVELVPRIFKDEEFEIIITDQ